MQGRGGGGRDPFSDFGDPFGGFGGFGSFGRPGSLISSVFGGRDPFDDPFFNRPFGGMFESSPLGGMFQSSSFGGMLQSSPFGGPAGFPFPPDMHPSGFLGHQPIQPPEPSRRRGPVIQELDSDNENEDATEEKKGNPRKHSRSNNDSFVELPDDEVEGKKTRHLQDRYEYNRFNASGPQFQPQTHSYCFQSSTVSYGGANGTYYTSSKTKRAGSDGVTFEESKEADTSTGQASHRISRGLHDKGHSLSRKLHSDGKVDSMQTLHNLNEDELPGFEEEWKGKGQKYLPGWTGSIGASGNRQIEQASQGGWALPSSENTHPVGSVSETRDEVGSSRTQERVKTDSSHRSAYHPRGRGRGRN